MDIKLDEKDKQAITYLHLKEAQKALRNALTVINTLLEEEENENQDRPAGLPVFTGNKVTGAE